MFTIILITVLIIVGASALFLGVLVSQLNDELKDERRNHTDNKLYLRGREDLAIAQREAVAKERDDAIKIVEMLLGELDKEHENLIQQYATADVAATLTFSQYMRDEYGHGLTGDQMAIDFDEAEMLQKQSMIDREKFQREFMDQLLGEEGQREFNEAFNKLPTDETVKFSDVDRALIDATDIDFNEISYLREPSFIDDYDVELVKQKTMSAPEEDRHNETEITQVDNNLGDEVKHAPNNPFI